MKPGTRVVLVQSTGHVLRGTLVEFAPPDSLQSVLENDCIVIRPVDPEEFARVAWDADTDTPTMAALREEHGPTLGTLIATHLLEPIQ